MAGSGVLEPHCHPETEWHASLMARVCGGAWVRAGSIDRGATCHQRTERRPGWCLPPGEVQREGAREPCPPLPAAAGGDGAAEEGAAALLARRLCQLGLAPFAMAVVLPAVLAQAPRLAQRTR